MFPGKNVGAIFKELEESMSEGISRFPEKFVADIFEGYPGASLEKVVEESSENQLQKKFQEDIRKQSLMEFLDKSLLECLEESCKKSVNIRRIQWKTPGRNYLKNAGKIQRRIPGGNTEAS